MFVEREAEQKAMGAGGLSGLLWSAKKATTAQAAHTLKDPASGLWCLGLTEMLSHKGRHTTQRTGKTQISQVVIW